MNYLEPGERKDAPPGPESLLTGLTLEQSQAVTHGAGPLLILAGPGAGKTRTLAQRSLICSRAEEPSRANEAIPGPAARVSV